MKILHLLKSEPDQLVSDLVEKSCQSSDCTVIKTFTPDVDWNDLVERIFSAEKVICWW